MFNIDDTVDLIGNPPAGLINLLIKVVIERLSTICCAIFISKPAGGYFFNRVIDNSLFIIRPILHNANLVFLEMKKGELKKKKIRGQKHCVGLLGPFPPAVGGIASNLQNLLASPLKKKYYFYCFQTTSRKCGSVNYQNELIQLKMLRVIVDIFKYILFLIKNHLDFIHINTSFGNWAFWRDSVYLAISRLWGKKILLQIHGGNLDDFLKHCGKIKSVIIKKILSLPFLIGVLSTKQQQPFLKAGLSQKVIIFPNMVDVNLFINVTGNNRLVFNFPEDCYLILFIAPHLFLGKGVYEFLKAASIILKNRNDVYFVIVGTGGEEIRMKKYCKEHDIDTNVRFMKKISYDNVIKIMLAADIFTLPSYNEGFPMVILEAMAAGLPVISTDVGAIPEIINEGENGFILTPKDYIALAEKITFLIEHSMLRKSMGDKNRIKVQQNYDLKIVSNKFDISYQKLLFH